MVQKSWRKVCDYADPSSFIIQVDADTKVYPDSLTRMISCMAHDHEIMGLCGETKIANKTDSFWTMIQGKTRSMGKRKSENLFIALLMCL